MNINFRIEIVRIPVEKPYFTVRIERRVKILKLTIPKGFTQEKIDSYINSNLESIEKEFDKLLSKENAMYENSGGRLTNNCSMRTLREYRLETMVKSRTGLKISHNFVCPLCLKDRYYGYSYIEKDKEIEICSQCYLKLRNPDPYLKYVPVNFEGNKSRH